MSHVPKLHGRGHKAVTSRGQRTRALLLRCAEEVFGEQGYDGAQVSEITRRAGVAQGTFYVHFTDKRQAFVELVRSLNERLEAEVAAAIAGLDDPVAIERARFRTFFHFVCAHKNLYRIVRQSELVDGATHRWYYRRLAQGYMRGLSRFMAQGRLASLDPELTAFCLMGVADLLGMRWALWQDRRPTDEQIEALTTFITRGLGAPRAQGG